ncbi:MAG: TPM domain-containing protein [Bacillati bacterium ANGP1]|uniref:TPM domain-containing protein n=1 Tax=Candidatus Segetimicrobium genomatis TaxID=2569760 RepID=A0A537K1P4_9BACT|nr:MAG: TPM domain-containing protein [Terrabacteria group bacterium ANGP1]
MATAARRLVTHTEKVRLRRLVEEIERETRVEIAALVVPHVDDLEQFATAYFNHVGIGKREHHNGVLIVVVVDRRRVRIEVGRGLEDVVPRDAAARIIAEVMAPELRRGRYGEGLIRGADAVGALVRAAGGAPRPDRGKPGEPGAR